MCFRRAVAIAAVILLSGLSVTPVHADGLGYFEQQIAPLRDQTTFIAPGPAFDAGKCMPHKSIFSIPVSSANPFTANIEKSMVAAAETRFKFTVWENQGQGSQRAQGMNGALSQNASLIDLLAGTDPRVLVRQAGAARAAGIPAVASHYDGIEQSASVRKEVTADIPIDYFKAGSLLLDWAVVQTKGNLGALVLIARECPHTGGMRTEAI